MKRRALLSAVVALAVGSAGCTQRRTVTELSATPTIRPGAFYHEPLDLRGADDQYNLSYTVTAESPFDVFLFGGRADPGEFGRYRAATRGAATGRQPNPSEIHSRLGATGTAEVNRPLAPGRHHFVVDNTRVGEATPDGDLRPEIALDLTDFDILPD